jgi:broad specificity phosphatase PhoE
MRSRIFVVRHAESKHNVDKNLDQLDPGLTDLGVQQAEQLGQTFPNPESISCVLTSPLQRAVQTTLSAFSSILNKRYFDAQSGRGVDGGAESLIDADAQERSDLLCDTGSDRDTLEKTFPHLDFSDLPENWPLKEGPYAPDDDALRARASKLRQRLRKLVESVEDTRKKDIVVVTHGVFMKFLTQDESIDLPKAGWSTYHAHQDAEGCSILVPVE